GRRRSIPLPPARCTVGLLFTITVPCMPRPPSSAECGRLRSAAVLRPSAWKAGHPARRLTKALTPISAESRHLAQGREVDPRATAGKHRAVTLPRRSLTMSHQAHGLARTSPVARSDAATTESRAATGWNGAMFSRVDDL